MPSRTGAVHVATTKRNYKGKTYVTHLLRRSVRKGDSVTHETLGNLSHLPDLTIDLIRRSLKGESFIPASSALRITRSRPHGHVEAVLAMIRATGVEHLIASKRSKSRDLIVAMIAERLLFPSSKSAHVRHWRGTTLPDELGIGDATEDHLYEAMDWLAARQAAIEGRLAARHLREGAAVLYDVSSRYYEGVTCKLARFGHDRDGKTGCPIIVYGMLTDDSGRPIAVTVYPGNTADPVTVPDQVEALAGRFGLSRVALVGDQGMITSAQIEVIKKHPGLGWITALRSRSIRRLLDEGRLVRGAVESEHLAEIASPDFPGERLVACYNPRLAAERRRKRGELLALTEVELEKLRISVSARPAGRAETAGQIGVRAGKMINHYKMAKHFTLTIRDGHLGWARKAEAIAEEEMLDGIYVIRTSEPASRLSAEDGVRAYKRLALVEQSFRCLKGTDLMVRPIHHRKEARVEAHIFVCMLAYYVEWHLRRAWGPLLFEDEELESRRRVRDPVAEATASASARAVKLTGSTAGGLPVQSFRTLMAHLATKCRNTCVLSGVEDGVSFEQMTEADSLQEEALRLIGL